jgi:hypothetical protein
VDRNHHRELKTSLAASIIFRQTKFNYLVYLILTAMLYPETVESFTSNPKQCVKAQEYRVQNGRINGENRRTERGCGEEDMQLQLSRLEIL